MTAPALDLAAVIPGDGVGHVELRQVGEKAANLAWLAARGLAVPPFVVVTTDACARLLEPVEADIRAWVAALDHEDAAALRRTARAIQDAVLDLSLPADLAAELAVRVRALDADQLAVRSSAVGEDSAAHSFAGQLDTRLNVAPPDVGPAVIACLASAYSERALYYRAHQGIGNDDVRAAVIVQVLVDSAVAGVAFSCNPQSGDRDEAVVTAGLGFGEGVVAGTAACDTFFVDVRSRRVTARILSEKATRIVRARDGGTVTVAADGATASEAAVTDQEIARIVGTAVELAETAGHPQDVEWAIDAAGRLHILQARPVTAVGGHQTIFDNVNVTESYPGITLPLSFSFVRRCYEEIFRNCQRDFGATARMAEGASADLLPYLVGFVRGRVYYNISNWYRMFLAVPGLERAIPAWEAALGIESRYRRPPEKRKGIALLRMRAWELRTAVVVLAGWLRLRGRVRRFFTTYEQFKVELDRYPPDDLGAHELHALLDRFMAELLPLYSVQIFNDFLAQQLFELVATLIERFGLGDDVVRLRNELFCGEEGVESVDPVRSALRLAQQVRSDAALRSLFEGPEGSEAVWFEVAANPQFSAFYAACEEHIRDYGDRTLEELKLETDPLGERPHDLVPALRNYLQGGQNVDDMTARERRIRNQAEKQVRAALRAHPVRRLMFGFVLRHARWGVKQRENLRLGRSRCFGFAKRLYRAIGHRLAEADLIDDPRDVFWLTREEVDAMTRGTIIDGDVRRLIRSRQADYEGWRHERLSSRIVTSGIAAAHPHVSELSMPDDAVVLHGVGCSPGTAKARALALTEPDSRVRVAGEILVAAATDPGWVFLMVAAGGLVSEKGSVLSHTAIIGRELGIPTVVGVAAATQRLADRVVLLDGGAGTVTIVEE